MTPVNHKGWGAAALLVLGSAALVQAAPASLNVPYSQDFDSLPQTGSGIAWSDDGTLSGWYASRPTFAAGTGSSNSGGLYSFGVDADRALGSLASGGTNTVYFGVRFTNDSAQTIDALTVRYRGEQWREGGSTTTAPSVAQKLDFAYQRNAADLTSGTWSDVDALDFVSPRFGATSASLLNGNLPENSLELSATLSGLSLAPGESLTLRWSDINDANNDHALAIDNLSVSTSGSSTPDAGVPDAGADAEVDAGAPCSLTPISIGSVQGTGETAAILSTATIQGVVVADFEGAQPALRGFYVQDRGDGNDASSDGIFVFNNNNDSVELGDEVQVTGAVSEFQGQTQLTASHLDVCARGQSVVPAEVKLPVATASSLERYEGMLVHFTQPLYVTELFQLGRFRQVTLSGGARLAQPTNVVAPGAAAAALQASNLLNEIVLDDALQSQNPDPIVFGRGGQPLSASNTLRGGDTVTGLTGVLTYTWGGNAASPNAYRVRPVRGAPNFVAANPRPTSVEKLGKLGIGSANLLNYFNTFTGCTLGVGGAAADCRGAENAQEYERQAAKTVRAIQLLDPAVLGVMELENDGYGTGSAIQDLVARLNTLLGANTFAFIDVDARVGRVNAAGTDAIKTALLYRPALVKPVDKATFADEDPIHNRAPIAQTFQLVQGGARFTVVVNHFKSKGCDGASGANLDQNDGQGCWNANRVAQAEALLSFLDDVRTSTGEPDILLIGDFNSYAKEDPIRTLEQGGYTNLIAKYSGPNAYSYVFDGQWGYLDHALASASFVKQAAGASDLHINADEPSVLDYNTNFKSAGQVSSLYAADAYRVSDHDPVRIGFTPKAPLSVFGKLLALLERLLGGSAFPLSFSAGESGRAQLLAGSPSSVQVDCSSLRPLGTPKPLTGKLTFDSLLRRYNFVWNTAQSDARTCRRVFIELDDGSSFSDVIRFR